MLRRKVKKLSTYNEKNDYAVTGFFCRQSKDGEYLERRFNMAYVGEVYLCEICSNKLKVLEAGEGELVCC